MRLALLTTDNREHFKDYANTQPYFGTAPEALLEGFKLLPSEVEVHVVSCLQQPPVSSPEKLADNIYYNPLIVPKLGWMRTGYQGCVRAVRRKLRQIQPDLVHGQGTERDCAVSAVQSGFPNVLTIHGNMARIAAQIRAKPFTYYWTAAHLERWCLRKTCGVVAISSYTAANVSPYAKQVWLVPNAVHADFFGVKHRDVKTRRLLCVANVSPWKNQIGLVEALDRLHRDSDFELRFIGATGGHDDYSTKFLRTVAERGWCKYVGTLDRNNLMQELASATALVLPSFEDNCPMVVLEAAAAGVPTAAASIGGIPDLIEDGRTGFLFDPRDPNSIIDAVRSVLSDNPRAATLAKAARNACLERHEPRRVAQRHLQLYDHTIKLVNSSGRA